jgi:uncharacterized protein (DUF2062 family)
VATWFVVICAVLASLAGGVMLAYGICVGMFSILRVRQQTVAATSQPRRPLVHTAQS